jgi:hypothetical protein
VNSLCLSTTLTDTVFDWQIMVMLAVVFRQRWFSGMAWRMPHGASQKTGL